MGEGGGEEGEEEGRMGRVVRRAPAIDRVAERAAWCVQTTCTHWVAA